MHTIRTHQQPSILWAELNCTRHCRSKGQHPLKLGPDCGCVIIGDNGSFSCRLLDAARFLRVRFLQLKWRLCVVLCCVFSHRYHCLVLLCVRSGWRASHGCVAINVFLRHVLDYMQSSAAWFVPTWYPRNLRDHLGAYNESLIKKKTNTNFVVRTCDVLILVRNGSSIWIINRFKVPLNHETVDNYFALLFPSHSAIKRTSQASARQRLIDFRAWRHQVKKEPFCTQSLYFLGS